MERVVELLKEAEQQTAERHVEQQHCPIAAEHLEKNRKKAIAQGIEVAAQETKLRQQHVNGADRVTGDVERGGVKLREKPHQQVWQQEQVDRQPQKRQDQLRTALPAGKGERFA